MKTNDKIKKDNPFTVPDGYFDTLTDRTMSAIRQSSVEEETDGAKVFPNMEASRTIVAAESGKSAASVESAGAGEEAGSEEATGTETGIPVRRINFRPYLSLAAAMVGVALLATVMIRVVTVDRAAGVYEEGSSLYADLAAEELDTYMIEDELFRTEPEDLTATDQTIASDVIIDYLMTEDIDLNDIYELL